MAMDDFPFPPFPPMIAPPATVLDHIADTELIIGSVLIIAFTVLYGVVFKWYLRRAGRAVLGVFSAISLMLGFILLTKLCGGDFPGRDLLRVAVYLALPVTVSYMIYGLVRSFVEGGQATITIESRKTKRAKARIPKP
jgi:predicted membrane channel-forming protein YqfA (hemolysin III family)